MEALSSTSSNFLDSNVLEPFFEYAESIPVVREFFLKQTFYSRPLDKQWPQDKNGKIDIVDVAQFIRNYHECSAPVLIQLYNVAITAGFTSTRVECLFSSLSRVDTAQRRSMKTERECDLAYLTFEYGILVNNITFDDYLHAWKASPRKLLQM